MTGGIIQLVANSGVEDRILNNEPQITFFKTVYRRHTPFSTEYIPLSFTGIPDFGRSVECFIYPHGDLVHRIFLTIEIPRIDTIFINSKTDDYLKNIDLPLINNKYPEIRNGVNFLKEKLECYNNEIYARKKILSEIQSFNDPIISITSHNSKLFLGSNFTPKTSNVLDLPPTYSHEFLDIESESAFDYVDFKNKLANIWLSEKNEYYLFYYLMELMYISEKNIYGSIPLIDSQNIANTIIYGSVFYNLIPENELLMQYYLKYLDFSNPSSLTDNSLINAYFSRLNTEYALLRNNINNYVYLNQVYSNDTVVGIDKTIIPTFENTNSYNFLSGVCNTLGNTINNLEESQNNFFEYGRGYLDIVNSFNVIIKTIQNVSTTVPIVICKSFEFDNSANPVPNIYTDLTSTPLKNTYFRTFVDPNFKTQFLLKVNDIERPIQDDTFTDIRVLNTIDQIYNNKYVSAYINFFNARANNMFSNIENGMDRIYERVRSKVFSTTYGMGLYLGDIRDNVYSYTNPTGPYQDNSTKRVTNTKNLNNFLFYFYKYYTDSDIFDFDNCATYVNTTFIGGEIPLLSSSIVIQIIEVIKKNLEYYMIEYSIMMNNFYKDSPSRELDDSMKNYSPMSRSKIDGGFDLSRNILATTLIMHRNHIPTILEFHQYIDYFISSITIDQVNDFGLSIVPATYVSEFEGAKILLSIINNCIFKYFMDKYDSFGFESPANFYPLTGEYERYKIAAYDYVKFVFDGITPPFNPRITYDNTNGITDQMIFYFCSEMLLMREMQKFYNDVLYEKSLIETNVGKLTSDIVTKLTQYLKNTDQDFDLESQISIFQQSNDPVKNYWDVLFKHNIEMGNADELYYSTFNTNRCISAFIPFSDTPYQSRHYGFVNNPVGPYDINDPYGVVPDYYDHKQVITDKIIPPTENDEELNEHIFVTWTNRSRSINTVNFNPDTRFRLFPIDFFRIKHSIFRNPLIIIPSDVRFIDEFQSNIYKILKILEYINEKRFPKYDYDIIYALRIYLFYIKKDNLDLNIFYETYLTVYQVSGFFVTYEQILIPLFDSITNELLTPNSQNYQYLTVQLIIESINMFKEIINKFNTGTTVQLYSQENPYTKNDLIRLNNYIYGDLIPNVNSSYNIIDYVRIRRDAFLTQYFYLAKYGESVNNIRLIGDDNDLLVFKNVKDIVYTILKSTNILDRNVSIFQNTSFYAYLYPDFFPNEINNILMVVDTLDDFSQSIFDTLTTFRISGLYPKLSLKDVFDNINLTFLSVKESYDYCLTFNVYDIVYPKLGEFQEMLNNKIILFNKIETYILKMDPLAPLTTEDIQLFATWANDVGIDYDDYYSYLEIISVEFNDLTNETPIGEYPYRRVVLIDVTLNRDLDYYFIKWVRGDLSITLGTTFKEYIINYIFGGGFGDEYPGLMSYYYIIPSNQYSYIFDFYTYVSNNNISIETMKNPLTGFNNTNLVNDGAFITDYYKSFSRLKNLLEYFMDVCWDYVMCLCEKSPFNVENLFGYSLRPTQIINQIYMTSYDEIQSNLDGLNDNLFVTAKINFDKLSEFFNKMIREDYFRRKKLDNVLDKNKINPLMTHNGQFNNEIFVNNVSISNVSYLDYYNDRLRERKLIIDFQKDLLMRSINDSESSRDKLNEYIDLSKIIFYRNKKSKNAWVKKLGHYLIQEVSIYADDQLLDSHNSDWIELFNQLTKKEGSEYGYNKMIGNIDSLNIFSDKTKDSYLLTIPLIFYFNRNIGLSLPLNSAMNTKFKINVKFRDLNSLIYKEQFSEFIDQENNMITPKINNAYIMAEYVYLTTEERKKFVTSRLEYLMEEVNSDNGKSANEKSTIPMYELGSEQKKIEKVINNKKRVFYEWITSKNIETDTIIDNSTNLIKNKNHNVREYKRKNGTVSNICEITYNNDPYVRFRRIKYRHYFFNPTQFMVFTMRPDKHIEPMIRNLDDNYFYGEKQWNNFSLLPEYDLSKIKSAISIYYEEIGVRMENISDIELGFINVLNNLINNPIYFKYDNPVNDFITENYSDYLESLHIIKNNFMNYSGSFRNIFVTIRLKESMMKLQINYNIYDFDVMTIMINEICSNLNVPVFNNTEILDALEAILDVVIDINNMVITKKIFIEVIYLLFLNMVQIGMLSTILLDNQIEVVYKKYNETQINLIISIILSRINIDILDFGFFDFIDYFYNLYILQPIQLRPVVDGLFSTLTRLLSMSSDEINVYNNYRINDLQYKNIIYQILPAIYPIMEPLSIVQDYQRKPKYEMINAICYKLNEMFNKIFDDMLVEIIDYKKNLIKNKKINPMIKGFIELNTKEIIPKNSNDIVWSSLKPYQHFLNTPDEGVNVYSWSLNPLSSQPSGSLNLSQIDEFTTVFDLDSRISDDNPVTINTHTLSMNILRVMSGLCGKAWMHK